MISKRLKKKLPFPLWKFEKKREKKKVKGKSYKTGKKKILSDVNFLSCYVTRVCKFFFRAGQGLFVVM